MTLPPPSPYIAGGATGIRNVGRTSINTAQRHFMRVSGNQSIYMPEQLTNKAKLISVYDCAGRLVNKSIAYKNILNLQKDLGISNGVYTVTVNNSSAAQK